MNILKGEKCEIKRKKTTPHPYCVMWISKEETLKWPRKALNIFFFDVLEINSQLLYVMFKECNYKAK